jgi:hypothetical protein
LKIAKGGAETIEDAYGGVRIVDPCEPDIIYYAILRRPEIG